MNSKTNGRGDAGDGDLGRGEDGEHHVCYHHGAWGRGGSRTGVAGQEEGLGSGLRSSQVGKRREPGSLLPGMSLPSPLGLSPAAGILPAAAVVAVSELKSFERSCCTSLRAFLQHEQAPRHLCLGRKQAQGFRALQQALPPGTELVSTKTSSQARGLQSRSTSPLCAAARALPAPSPTTVPLLPSLRPHPRLQQKAETLLQHRSMEPHRISDGILSSLAHS